MVYVVYKTKGVIQFVSHELATLLEYIQKHKHHSVEVWTSDGRRSGHQ